MNIRIQSRAGRGVRRAAVLICLTVSLAACGRAATSSSPGSAGAATGGSAALASRIIAVSTLQARLAANQPTVLLFMATGC